MNIVEHVVNHVNMNRSDCLSEFAVYRLGPETEIYNKIA